MTAIASPEQFLPSVAMAQIFLEGARAVLRQIKETREEGALDGSDLFTVEGDGEKASAKPFNPETHPLPSKPEAQRIMARVIKGVLMRAVERRRIGFFKEDVLGEGKFIPLVAQEFFDALPIEETRENEFNELAFTEVRSFLKEGGEFVGTEGRVEVDGDEIRIELFDEPAVRPLPPAPSRVRVAKL